MDESRHGRRFVVLRGWMLDDLAGLDLSAAYGRPAPSSQAVGRPVTMPNPAWAQAGHPLHAAVEAAMMAVRVDMPYPPHEDYAVMLGAALPHLLAAVVGAMEGVAPECPDEVEVAERFIPRAKLLATLTDAAGRLS